MKKGHKDPSSRKAKSRPGHTAGRTLLEQPSLQLMVAIFKSCGIELTPQQADRFWTYHGLLRHHNIELNLTRIHNFTNMVLKLYIDSVLPCRLTDLPAPLMDLGTGPGMPGIPLKIMRPELDIRLAEGRAKRVAFLREVAAQLGLDDIGIIDRNITPAFEQPVAGVITRAVETMDQTLDRVHGCLAQQGRVIFMKGPGCGAEIDQAKANFGRQFALIEDRAYRIGQTAHARRLVIFERLDAPPRHWSAQAARRHKVLEITSEHNSHFKSLKKLLTSRGLKKAGQALMAGSRPVAEMMAAFPERCLAWITNGDHSPPPAQAPAAMHWLQLSDPLFQMLDLFGTQGPLLCLAVPPIVSWTPEEGFPVGCSLLVPFQDPENIGAVIRSAAAFGVAQVILLAESAHPYHPKALRASGGVTPMVSLRQGPRLKALPRHLAIVALSADGQNIDEVDFPSAFGLLAGLEGEGLPSQWRDRAVRIPIHSAIESLNAATATAVALYEWQRRCPAQSPE